MMSEIERGIAMMFQDAVRHCVAADLKTPEDWQRFKEIEGEARAQRQDEIDRFERHCPARLAAARKEIIDKAGAKTLEHPTPFGIDRFNERDIERQAVAQVSSAHQARLMRISQDETAAYDDLRDDICAREDWRDHGRDAFQRAAEPVLDARLPDRTR